MKFFFSKFQLATHDERGDATEKARLFSNVLELFGSAESGD